MKYLVFVLTFAAFAFAQRPQVSECFKVRELLRADEEHYWATWTNSCPYTIDAVYVMVQFADRSSKTVADGVWGLHFIQAGAHRTMRFSAPGKLHDFASVHERKITTDMNEAFGKPATPLSPMEKAAVLAYRGAVAKNEVERSGMPVSVVIGDSGEAGYAAAVAVKDVVLNDVLTAVGRVMAVADEAPGKIIRDPGEASFRTDFPDSWRAVLTPQESSVTIAPRGSFVRFVDDRPIFP